MEWRVDTRPGDHEYPLRLDETGNSSLVQSVERRTVNPYVTGSSPVGGANSLVVQSVERRTVNPYVTGSSPVEGATF